MEEALKFVKCLWIIFFFNKRSFVHFLRIRGEGSQNWTFFMDAKSMTSNICARVSFLIKLQIEACNFIKK